MLLPVRDAAPWLGASLASLARQTFRDFEVIAVDDGSRDDSGPLLERWARRDPRLRVAHTPARGLPAALTTALGLARGRLIARHDADDLSHRRRFALQHAFLAAHRGVAVVGCRVRLFPAAAFGDGMRRWARWHNGLMTHEAMAREALIDSPLAHGTALMRRPALERAGGWIERGWAEDVDLWLRLIADGARLAKLRQTLYGWRQHPASATRRDPRYGRDRFLALRLAALEAGLLAGAERLTLVGVGASLAVWRAALTRPGRRIDVIDGRMRPGHAAPAPPVVLVFGAPAARERWRAALTANGLSEGDAFVFVA
ncbi:MAG: glycosyltransferase family 2 protein [Candidatus Eisenbacteria bacterium]|uniref:Glycosyltransferase family 2 protein n=1 Tax=Eiseniibacteriota bacterium TaxID=2212470 RepID=A0A9D6QN69_UNCEI|nr:glycosyltransferase family 2 protein [Candidatus Eisenbacteria bacterium]